MRERVHSGLGLHGWAAGHLTLTLSLEASCQQPPASSPPYPDPLQHPGRAGATSAVSSAASSSENRKGLSSHARSHLRQMGVTEWSVNGSPIDTLREILKKKSKPCLIKKEPRRDLALP